MSHSERHLSSERIQGFLDRGLAPEAESAVRKHLDACARCRGEVEGWRALFARLSEMPEIAPSPEFRHKVMEAVEIPSRSGVLTSLKKLLPSWTPWFGVPGTRTRDHLEPRIALAYLDRALSPRRRRTVATHVEDCASCREEMARWRTVIEAVEGLGHESPRSSFADAVMARVEVPTPASGPRRAGILEEMAARVRGLAPRSRRGRAVAGAAALAPVAALTTAVFAFFGAHPLLTPGSLASFTWWQVTGAVQSGSAVLAQRVMASPLVLEIWQVVQGLVSEPLMAGAGALAFGFTTFTALWILYRNLTTAPPVDRGYANVSA